MLDPIKTLEALAGKNPSGQRKTNNSKLFSRLANPKPMASDSIAPPVASTKPAQQSPGVLSNVGNMLGAGANVLGQGLYGAANTLSGNRIDPASERLLGIPASEQFKHNIEGFRAGYSPSVTQQQQNIGQAEGAIGTAAAMLTNPLGSGAMLAESLPSMVPVLGAARLAGAAGAIGASGALGGGFASVDARERAKELGATDEQAQQAAMQAFKVGAPISAAAGLISPTFEPMIARGGLSTLSGKAIAGRIAAEGAEEAVQEGLGEQFAANVGVREVDPNQALFEGVPESATAGGILGAGTATGLSGLAKASEALANRGQRDTTQNEQISEPNKPKKPVPNTVPQPQTDGALTDDQLRQLAQQYAPSAQQEGQSLAELEVPVLEGELLGPEQSQRGITDDPSIRGSTTPSGAIGTDRPTGGGAAESQQLIGYDPASGAGEILTAGEAADNEIDQAAHQAATSPLNALPSPTEGQKQAGNYAKGHVKLLGLDVSIENPKGSIRSGQNADGVPWENIMQSHYGYIKRTEGSDGDQVDVFLGPRPTREDYPVYVVDQVNPDTGQFDEHKVMVGFPNEARAVRAYNANYAADWQGLGAITPFDLNSFKSWLKDKAATKQPVNPDIGVSDDRTAAELRGTETPTSSLEPQTPENNSGQQELGGTLRSAAGADREIEQDDLQSRGGGEFSAGSIASSTGGLQTATGADGGANTAIGAAEQGKLAAAAGNDAIAAQPPATAIDTAQQGRKANTNTKDVDPTKDSVFQAIAKLGGIDRTEAEGQGVDPAVFKDRRKNQPFFGKPVFRKANGKTFDEMAEALSELGYFGNRDYTANELMEMLDKELRDEPVYAPAGVETQAEQMLADFEFTQQEMEESGYNELDQLGQQVAEAIATIQTLAGEDDAESIIDAANRHAGDDDAKFLEAIQRATQAYADQTREGSADRQETGADTQGQPDEGLTNDARQPSIEDNAEAERGASEPQTADPTGDRALQSEDGSFSGDSGYVRPHSRQSRPADNADSESDRNSGNVEKSTEASTSQPAVTAPTIEDDPQALEEYLRDVTAWMRGNYVPDQGLWIDAPLSSEERKDRRLIVSVDAAKRLENADTPKQRRAALRKADNDWDIAKAAAQQAMDEFVLDQETEQQVAEREAAAKQQQADEAKTDRAAKQKADADRQAASPLVLGDTDQRDMLVDARQAELEEGTTDADRSRPDTSTEDTQPDTVQAESAGQQPESVGRARAEQYDDTTAQSGDQGTVQEPENEVDGSVSASDTGAEGTGRNDATAVDRPDNAPGSQTNYRITADDQLGAGGAKTKARQNIRAIQIVKQLAQEQRPATDDEKAALVKYTGWGASELASNLFPKNNKPRKGWESLHAELKGLLTKEEWRSASNSTQFAHYTSPEVISGIYQGLERMGFTGGLVLEPGMGVGHFVGLMPPSMAAESSYTGIEYDPITAQIAKALYPESAIHHADFIKHPVPPNAYALAIGNPPFAQGAIRADKNYRKHGFSLHEYFIAKSIDGVMPGGFAVFVTSRYLMDKKADKARSYLADRADLVAAIRLPQTAFKKNAGTDVVTDILFLQKRAEGQPAKGENWLKQDSIKIGDENALINQYFIANPEMVLGQNAMTGTMRRANEYTVEAPQDFTAALQNALQKLPEDVFASGVDMQAMIEAAAEMDFSAIDRKQNSYYLDGDTLMQVGIGGAGKPVALKQGSKGKGLFKKQAAQMRSLIPVKEAAMSLLDAQLNDKAEWPAIQVELNKRYNEFVDEFGLINQVEFRSRKAADGTVTEYEFNPNFPKAMRSDPDWAILATLDTHDPITGNTTKGDLLTGRVLEPQAPPKIESPSDALASVLNQTGRVDIPAIAEALDIEPDAVIEMLGDLVYLNPITDSYQTSDEYLSGHVRTKLREAQLAASDDPAFKRNVKALQEVQPTDIPASQIGAKLGAAWIPASDIEGFIAESVGIEVTINFARAINKWSVVAKSTVDSDLAAKYRTSRMSATEILSAGLNQKQIAIYDKTKDDGRVLNQEATELARQKLMDLKDAFNKWIFSDGDRADRLAGIYNETYNDIVPRKFDGSHLTFPGMSMRYALRPHQKRVVWRHLQNGNTYMAHTVGAGKTMASVAAGMEMKRLGLINKPMYAVPNHMLNQFSREFVELYPNAKLLVADEENFHTSVRQEFVARSATESWDAVIITHSAFGMIKAPQATEQAMIQGEIDKYQDALEDVDESDRITRKQIENKLDRLKDRLDTMSDRRADQGINFDQLGVDYLFVDEAHEFRKLEFATTQGNIKGIDPTGSKRSWDLYVKSKYLDELRPGRNLTLMSGTPVTNTLGEMYTVQRFMNEQELIDKGLDHFDQWTAQFADTRAITEQNASGGYNIVTRLSQFVNVPELLKMFRDYADVIRPADLDAYVKRPAIKGGKIELVTVDATPAMKAYQQELAQRQQAIENRTGPPKPGEDIVLNVITDGRHAALDDRYIDAGMQSNPNSKLNRMIDSVYQVWEDTKDAEYVDQNTGDISPIKGATQMVFQDLGVSDKRGFSAYDWIGERLEAMGIPKGEIAYMRDYKKNADKLKLFSEMNAGKKRILIGSSRNMGTGVNAQQRLIALHHADAPWYPADMEQRNGRIVRQGNQNDEVQLFGYATRGTYDSTMFTMIETKQRFIDQMWQDDFSIRELEDVAGDADQYAVMKALSSGDERLIQKVALEQDLTRLQRLKQGHMDDQVAARRKIKTANASIPYFEGKLQEAKAALNDRIDTKAKAFKATVGKKSFNDRKKAGAAIIAEAVKLDNNNKADRQEVQIGEMAGFPIMAHIRARIVRDNKLGKRGHPAGIFLDVPTYNDEYLLNGGEKAAGIVASLENMARGIEKGIEDIQQSITKLRAQKRQAEATLGQKFDREKELQEKLAQLSDLESQILSSAVEDADNLGADFVQSNVPFDVPGNRLPPADSLYSRGTRSTGQHIEDLTNTLNRDFGARTIKRLSDNGTLKIVASLDDLPGKDHPADVKAAYIDGTAYLVAGNIPVGEERGILLHEIGVHHGLKTMLGDNLYKNVLNRVKQKIDEGDVAFVNARNRVPPDTNRKFVLEETVAYLVEENPDVGIIKRVVASLRNFARRLGIVNNVTVEDLAHMARGAVNRAARGSNYVRSTGTTLYSRGWIEGLDHAVRSMPNRPVMQTIRDLVGDKVEDYRRDWLGLLTRQQVVDVGKDVLPEAKAHLKKAQRMDSDKIKHMELGHEITEEWLKVISKKRGQAAKMADLMFDATLAEIDPAEPATTHTDMGVYMELKGRWNALDTDVQDLYIKVRNAYETRYFETQDALIQRIMDSEVEQKFKKALIDAIRVQFEQAKPNGPYFPLKRFGDYWVFVKPARADQEPAFFMAETAAEQKRIVRGLQNMGFSTANITSGKHINNLRQVQGATPGFMADLQTLLNQSDADPSLMNDVYQLYLQSLPESSIRKQFIHRKGTLGFSKDALRGFAALWFHGSHQLARIEHGHVLADQIAKMRKAAPNTSDPNKAADIVNELGKRHEWAMNPQNSSWASSATSIGFAWYLGITPAAALVNLTQTPIVAFPVLGAKFGASKAANALTRGMKDFAAMNIGTKAMRDRAKERLAKRAYGADTLTAIEQLYEDGVLDRTLAHSLAQLGDTDSGAGGTLFAHRMRKAMGVISWSFHHAERANRESTAMAAYRLARSSGQGHEAAIDYARDAVYESQFDYSNANRARFMQSNTAKVLLLFRQYSQNITYLLWRNVHQAAKGESPDVRREARNKLAGILGMTGVFAGAMGMPLFSVVMTAIKDADDLFGDDDDPIDPELAFRQFLSEMLGSEAGAIIAKGPINVLGADIATRTSLGELWLRSPDRELESRDLGGYWLEQIAGPLAGIGINAFRGLGLIEDGHTQRGIETMSPKWLKDALKAIRYSQEGVQNLRGDPVVEDTSAGQEILQALGFTPTAVSERYDENNALKRMERRILNRRKHLIDRYARAYRYRDRDELNRIMDSIMKFNERQPTAAITARTLRRSMKSREARSREFQSGVRFDPRLRAQLDGSRFLG